MTLTKAQLTEAQEYIQEFAVGMDEEGLDRENDARHLFVAAQLIALVLSEEYILIKKNEVTERMKEIGSEVQFNAMIDAAEPVITE